MSPNGEKPQRPDNEKMEFLLARYSALKEEMQHRSSNNYQMISLHLTISAAILSYGLQSSSPASVLFIAPIISLFLGILATHNWLAGRKLEMMIKMDVEEKFNFVSKDPLHQKSHLPVLVIGIGEGGVFVVVQILALVLGVIKIQYYTSLDIVLIISDILSVLMILWLFRIVLKVLNKEKTSAQQTGSVLS